MVGQLAEKLEDALNQTEKEDLYLNYIMLAVASVKLGNFEKALRYYCLAHIHKKRLVLYNFERPEWQTKTSILFYIAQLLRSLMPV